MINKGFKVTQFHVYKVVSTLALSLAAVVTSAQTSLQNTGHTRVVRITVYPEYANGDVVFTVENPAPACGDGFWLSPASPGFKQTLAILLMLKSSGAKFEAFGSPDRLWPGSSGKYCAVYALSPV